MKKEVIINLDLYKKYKSEYAPDSFHHVAFKTQNYDAMVEFYEKLFGCKPMYKSNDIAFLAFDEEHHRIAIANTEPGVKKLGFIYEKKYEKKIENRRFFYKNKNNHREIHIHLVNKNTYWYKRHIAFRNALRQNALLKLQYQALKTKLSEKEWIDSNEYAEAKSPFIRSIEKKLNII